AHREEGIEDDLLRDDADRAPGRAEVARDVVAHHGERARVGDGEPAERGDERGLAGAVGAQEAEELALGHLERDAGQRAHRPEALLDAAHLDGRHQAAWGWISSATP